MPLSSRDKSESLWMDRNFQKEKCPEIQVYLGIEETRERQEVFRLHLRAESERDSISIPKKQHKSLLLKNQCFLPNISTPANSSHLLKYVTNHGSKIHLPLYTSLG